MPDFRFTIIASDALKLTKFNTLCQMYHKFHNRIVIMINILLTERITLVQKDSFLVIQTLNVHRTQDTTLTI